MGRIKQKFIKNRAFDLVEAHKDFGKDFKKNKEALKDFADVASKKIKNKLAGYITRLEKRKPAY